LAAKLMRKEAHQMMLAKVDATIEQELAQQYAIEGYPTLKIFHKNSPQPVDYEGPREPGEAIVEYLKVYADPKWTPPPSAVVVLGKDNFTEFVNNEDVTLIEFYAPWCGYCKRLEPKFEKAAAKLKTDTPIRLAKVDATVEPDLAIAHNVTGYVDN
jgi:protein disulfide-isomerase A4